MVCRGGISTPLECLLTQRCHSRCQYAAPEPSVSWLVLSEPMDQMLDGKHNVPERKTYCNFNYAQLTSDAFSDSAVSGMVHLH